MIAKHEAPTVRLPYRLPSRPRTIPDREEESNDIDDPSSNGASDGVADRLFFKTAAMNVLKKSNKLNKTEDGNKMLVQTL